MLTSLGKFFRKLRIDNGEKLKDMADRLKVTSAFLSAVENGKKKMPTDWSQKIPEIYEFDDNISEQFLQAVAETEKSLEINFKETSEENRRLVVSFARKFNDFDESQLAAIRKILNGGDKS